MLQLLHMFDKWTEYLDGGGQFDAIYSDLSKSPGPDMLHPRVLYECRDVIVYPLFLLCSKRFQDGNSTGLETRRGYCDI